MLHMRIVVPHDRSDSALELLLRAPSVCNVIELGAVSRKPEGDVILCDIAREDTSVVISDLKELGVHIDGSIALEVIDTELSRFADHAEELAKGAAGDAVVWEEVEERSEENVELSAAFMWFMVLAGLIASVGIFLDSAILVVGAMVVGPEFGPIAGFCVAVVQKRPSLARRSFVALAVGFPAAIVTVFAATLAFKATGITPETFSESDHQLSNVIANPDFFAFFVAACAGAAGMLSLTTSKSGALIGVLISVTTIPAAANIGVSAAYGDWEAWRGSAGQLAINLGAILLAGTLTLYLQRRAFQRRRRRHLSDESRRASGLPPGRSRQAPRERSTT